MKIKLYLNGYYYREINVNSLRELPYKDKVWSVNNEIKTISKYIYFEIATYNDKYGHAISLALLNNQNYIIGSFDYGCLPCIIERDILDLNFKNVFIDKKNNYDKISKYDLLDIE